MNFLLGVFLKLGRIGRIARGVFGISSNDQQGAAIWRKNQRTQIYALVSFVLRQLLRLIIGGFGIKYIALSFVVEHPGHRLAVRGRSHVGRKGCRQVVTELLGHPLEGTKKDRKEKQEIFHGSRFWYKVQNLFNFQKKPRCDR